MKHYVYIMKAKGWAKIGVSHNVERRLKMMQTGCPLKIMIMNKFPFDSRAQAFECENALHRLLKEHRERGEWFRYAAIRESLNFKVKGFDLALGPDLAWAAEILNTP